MWTLHVLRLVLRVESIGESVISVYNKHNDKIRPLSKDNVNDELFVALNGPQLGEADEVLEKSLDLHFKAVCILLPTLCSKQTVL